MRSLILSLVLVIGTSCGSNNSNPEPAPEPTPIPEPTNTTPKLVSLNIAAFNVQILGKTKMSKSEVVKVLVKIISKYDIILIQEIKDISQNTPYELLDEVNIATGNKYDLVLSDRLGRTSSKEQYAYFYRNDAGLSVEHSEEFLENSDEFEREPFIVEFKINSQFFTLIGSHIKPTDAINEINYLDNVYEYVENNSSSNDIIILGDLNADCSYVNDTEYNMLDLKVSKEFIWHIDRTIDTTTKNTNCAYDHVISKSKAISNAKIFDFKVAYGLSQFEVEAVSDHFPIEFNLKIESN